MGTATERGTWQHPRFARAKFCPPPLPTPLVTRRELQDRLMAGAGQALTVVVGSAGAGKTVLLSSWAVARAPQVTSWLSCDEADANPVRFWTGFIEASRGTLPGFGADAAELLALDGTASPDVTASIANDAVRMPAGSAVVVDDYHYAAAATSGDMRDLVTRWPPGGAQLVLASRSDPALRLHRLRLAGQLCELRDRDLSFSLAESRDLLSGFGVQVSPDDLTLLHRRSEGWAAALQMAALSLRTAGDPARTARALEINSDAIAEYFTAEVLDQQPPDVADFMLDTSILGTLTAQACAALTGRHDAAALLRAIDAAGLFLVPLDEERTALRYHHLVRQLLRAELRARDPAREQTLQLRAGEWFEGNGDIRRATRHFFAARQGDRALTLLQDHLVADYLRDPAQPPPPDLSMLDPAVLARAPDKLLALALDLVISGDTSRSGQYLELLEHAESPLPPDSPLAARLAATWCAHHALTGHVDRAVSKASAARAIQERGGFSDEWVATLPMILMRAYAWLEDYAAVDREAAAALAAPELSDPVKEILVAGARALAWLEAGHLADAADAATNAAMAARRLGFERHIFALEHLRALAGLAQERRDLDTAERLTEQALSIAEQRRPIYTYAVLLDRAALWGARGQVRQALLTIDQARSVLADTAAVVLARADELEALLRLSLGDLDSPATLAGELPAGPRDLLHARIALAAGDHHRTHAHLQAPSLAHPTPRRALVRQILLAATAIERDDPMTAGIIGGILDTARRGGFLNTVVTTADQVTRYLAAHSAQLRPHPYTEQLIAAALDEHATHPGAAPTGAALIDRLTPAEQRVLQLLPASTADQIAATLFVSRSTVKTHLRSVYHKLGVTSRAQAIERAVDLRIL